MGPHAMWSIPELLLEIAHHMERHDRVVMARVCRAFWTVVTTLIWDSLPFGYGHLRGLIRPEGDVFTPDKEKSDLLQESSTRYREADLKSRERFELYRGIVKSLELECDDDDSLITFLSSLANPAFPNLDSLSMKIRDIRLDTLEGILDAIISTPVHSISFRFPRWYSEVGLCKAAANKIGSLTGHLKTLSIIMLSERIEDGALDAIARAIRANPELKELTLGDSTEAGYQVPFDAASHLLLLEKLSFFSEYVRLADPTLSPTKGFPSLKSFNGDIAVHSVPNLLESFEKAPLQRLSLYSAPARGDGGVEGYFSKLAQFESLIHFDLIINSTSTRGIWNNILAPLASSRNLESLVLDIHTIVMEIDDIVIRKIAEAWPSLQTLELRKSYYEEDDRPSATLAGLQSLSERCPRLSRIQISVTVTNIPKTIQPFAVGRSVKSLDFLFSRIMEAEESEEVIADFICKMWPNHTEGSRNVSHQVDERWAKVWGFVNDRIGEPMSA